MPTPDLSGRSVLVVEDDFYTAMDMADALRAAGATVIGPCPDESSAATRLASEKPTVAVLDLNLGPGGPRFALARALRARAVPMVFVTGYGAEVVPEDLRHIRRVAKPAAFDSVLAEVAALLEQTTGGRLDD